MLEKNKPNKYLHVYVHWNIKPSMHKLLWLLWTATVKSHVFHYIKIPQAAFVPLQLTRVRHFQFSTIINMLLRKKKILSLHYKEQGLEWTEITATKGILIRHLKTQQSVGYLSSNKLFQPFNGHPPPEHTANRRKPWVIPGK